MRVVVPFTELHNEVVQVLAGTGYPIDLRDVSASDSAYWDLVRGLWADGETFCIVEHDVVVRRTSLLELDACSHDWCGFPVSYSGTEYAGLSCTKFTDQLIARHPDAFEVIDELYDEKHPPHHWCRLDTWLRCYVLERGKHDQMHVHAPALEHLRSGEECCVQPSHDCHQRA